MRLKYTSTPEIPAHDSIRNGESLRITKLLKIDAGDDGKQGIN